MRHGEGTARKPARVTLWGVSDYADQYLGCLREAGVEPAAWVAAGHAGGTVHGVEALSAAEYARRCYLYPGVPLVLLAEGPDGAGGFDDALRTVVNELDLPGPVFHPVALADHLRLDYAGHVVLGAFPGADDGLVHGLLTHLLAHHAGHGSALGARERLFTRLAGEYHFHTLRPAVDDLFDLGGRHASVDSTISGDRIRIEMHLANDRLGMLCHLRSRTYLQERVHATPEPMSAGAVERFRWLGFSMLVVVRHPVDVIVSAAATLSRPPARALANLEWFRRMAEVVREYYAHVLEQQAHGLVPVRYERLLEAPAKTVREIGRAVDLDLGPAEAEATWDAVAFTRPGGPRGAVVHGGSLGRGAGHPWLPAPGAFRDVLGAAHVDLLRDLDYGALLDGLGYPTTLTASDRDTPADGARPMSPREAREAAYLDFGYHVLYGKPIDFRHPGLVHEHDASLGLEFVASDPTLWDVLKLGLASRYFRWQLTAGTGRAATMPDAGSVRASRRALS